jgi:hypothetical protein
MRIEAEQTAVSAAGPESEGGRGPSRRCAQPSAKHLPEGVAQLLGGTEISRGRLAAIAEHGNADRSAAEEAAGVGMAELAAVPGEGIEDRIHDEGDGWGSTPFRVAAR